MWTLDNPSLPATPALAPRAPLLLFDVGQMTPLAQLALNAQYQSPDIVLDWDPIALTIPAPELIGTTATLDLSHAEAVLVNLATVGGITFTPALDPLNPLPGEFVFNDQTRALTLHTDAQHPVKSGQVVAIDAGVDVIPTNYVPGHLLDVLHGLPVTGELTWSESLEQHPSGQLKLVLNDGTIAIVRRRLKKGTELTVFGRGFSVSNFSEELSSNGLFEISVSLTGKWARPTYNRPSFLRGGGIHSQPTSTIKLDPDCGLEPTTAPGAGKKASSVSVAALAAQVNVPFVVAGSTASGMTTYGGGKTKLGPWSVAVPADTESDATASWTSEAQSRMRPNECYIDFTHPNAVYARNVHNGDRWTYRVDQLKTTYQGDCKNSPDHRGYAVEYINAQITGDFEAEPEKDAAQNKDPQPRPTWKPRQPKRITLESGDKDPTQPPPNTKRLKTVSLNWDTSGPTKTLKKTTTEDGQPVLDEELLYGFCYTAKEIVDPYDGTLNGVPEGHWQQVSYKRTDYLYDSKYGYALGHNVTGWHMGRFKTESDENPETLLMRDTPRDAPYKELYKFRKLATIEQSRLVLENFYNYYLCAQQDPPYQQWKNCHRDGTSTIEFVPDPTWAPPMFVKDELTYTSSFAHTPNPDSDITRRFQPGSSTPDGKLPDYITGEESTVHTVREIMPSTNTKPGVGEEKQSFSFDRVAKLEFDRYVERHIEDSAQGANFRDKAVKETFTEYDGRPSIATRKPALMEPEKPEPKEGDPNQKKDPNRYQYFISTPGWGIQNASGGSVSFQTSTVSGALRGAKTDLLLRDLSESVQYQFQIPFNRQLRCLDRIHLLAQGESHGVRVVSVSHKLFIEGVVDDVPLITADLSEVSAGLDRVIPVTFSRRELPSSSSAPTPKPITPPPPPGAPNQTKKLTIADVSDAKTITRRNF